MYEDLINRLREPCQYENCILCQQAADTIEQLCRDLDAMNEANIALYGALPRWIPVTERLPEEAGKYLVCGRWRGKQTEIWVCEFIALGCLKGWANNAANPPVTHWMPRPTPSEEE